MAHGAGLSILQPDSIAKPFLPLVTLIFNSLQCHLINVFKQYSQAQYIFSSKFKENSKYCTSFFVIRSEKCNNSCITLEVMFQIATNYEISNNSIDLRKFLNLFKVYFPTSEAHASLQYIQSTCHLFLIGLVICDIINIVRQCDIPWDMLVNAVLLNYIVAKSSRDKYA